MIFNLFNYVLSNGSESGGSDCPICEDVGSLMMARQMVRRLWCTVYVVVPWGSLVRSMVRWSGELRRAYWSMESNWCSTTFLSRKLISSSKSIRNILCPF